MGISKGGSFDALVVRTKDLREVILPYLERHMAEHDTRSRGNRQTILQSDAHSGVPGERNINGFGAFQYLANEAGKTERQIYRIMSGESEFTAFYIADDILTALERPDLMHVLKPVPNPRWSREHWERWRTEQLGQCE